jgi:hypothetical protein
MEKLKLHTDKPRKLYQPPAVSYEAPLEVRAGTPLIKILKPDLTDPAKLWKK